MATIVFRFFKKRLTRRSCGNSNLHFCFKWFDDVSSAQKMGMSKGTISILLNISVNRDETHSKELSRLSAGGSVMSYAFIDKAKSDLTIYNAHYKSLSPRRGGIQSRENADRLSILYGDRMSMLTLSICCFPGDYESASPRSSLLNRLEYESKRRKLISRFDLYNFILSSDLFCWTAAIF